MKKQKTVFQNLQEIQMTKQKIFLTGGSGMVGSNIREIMLKSQFEIIAPDFNELNLLEYNNVNTFYLKHKFDFVIHAAGIVGGIQANIRDPVRFLVENTQMANNVLISAKKNNVKKLLNLGSSCMYPYNAPNPLTESSILSGPLEPTNEGYALAKIYALRLCEYINKENHEFQYKTLIPCNLFGKYDKFDPANSHLIPSIIHKIHDANVNNNTSVEIWGNGKARREFMYAGDFANFIWYAVMHFNTIPNVINIGLGFDFEIEDYYKTVADVLGYNGTFIYNLSKPVGMNRKLIDITKQSKIGWSPKHSLKDGIRLTYEYYLSLKTASS